MWEQFVNWFWDHGLGALIWSGVAVVIALAVHLLLRRMAARSGHITTRRRRRMAALALGIILLLVLMRLWFGAAMGPLGDQAPRMRLILKNALWTLALAAVIYLLTKTTQHGLIRQGVDVETRYRIRVTTAWIGVGVFVIAAIFVWVSRVSDFGIFLGIVGAGLALSLQETLLSIVGWLVLIVHRPFGIGDRIEINGKIGDVIGISAIQTSMLEVGNWVRADQSTGRMLIIPNSQIIRHGIFNYSKGFPFVWNEFSIVVTFESDWGAAKEMMLEKAEVEADKIESEVKRQIEQMQSRYVIRYSQLRPIVYTDIDNHGVRLTLRYLSPVRQRRATTHRISENVLRAIIPHRTIDFAYPTTRIYRNTEEGKEAIGGPPHDQPPPDIPRHME